MTTPSGADGDPATIMTADSSATETGATWRGRAVSAALAALWAAGMSVLGFGSSQSVFGVPDDLAKPTQHLVGLAVLGALVAYVVRWRPFVLVAALVGLGLLGEVVQLAVPARTFEGADVVIDTAGASIGVGLVRWRPRRTVKVGVHVFAVAILVSSPWLLSPSGPNTRRDASCRPAPPPATDAPELVLDRRDLADAVLPVRIVEPAPKAVRNAVVETGELTVAAWFQTSNLSQDGPVRLITMSRGYNAFQVNMHLGVQGDDVTVRLRTSCDLFNEVIASDVLEADRLHHAAFTWQGGEVVIWVDGVVEARKRFDWGDLDRWDGNYPIVVGDEAIGGRLFDGTIRAVSIWDGALSGAEINAQVSDPPAG